MKRVCVLRSGKDFQPKHVQWLAKQVDGLVCLSDVAVEGVYVAPLKHNWPGWWSKMELFRPDIEGDLLYFDLDTVVKGDLTRFDVGETTMLSDFYRPHKVGSGLMYIKHEDKAGVWKEWMRCPEDHMKRCRTGESWGDQGFLERVLQCRRWQDVLPGRVASYKCSSPAEIAAADVVCFHGQPRPWAVKDSWVPPL